MIAERGLRIADLIAGVRLLCLAVIVVALCFFPFVSFAAEAHFVWAPNTETNLAGYKIYYGTASRQYSDLVDVKKATLVAGRVYGAVTGLAAGTTYYFVATAYDTDGFESDYSKEVVWTAAEDIYPAAPELMLTILRRHPNGTVDLLDAQGAVIAVGVKLP